MAKQMKFPWAEDKVDKPVMEKFKENMGGIELSLDAISKHVRSRPVDLDTIEKSEAEGDTARMEKYFWVMKQVPALEGKKARSRAAEYFDDLRLFTDKWEGEF